LSAFGTSGPSLARKLFVMSEVTELKVHGDSSFDVLDDSFDVQTPILENMVVGVPPVFEGLTKQLDKIVEQPLLGPKTKFPAGRMSIVHLRCTMCADQLL